MIFISESFKNICADYTNVLFSNLAIPTGATVEYDTSNSSQTICKCVGTNTPSDDSSQNVCRCFRTIGLSEDSSRNICKCGRTIRLSGDSALEDYEMFYIGGESLTLTNLLLTFNKNQFYSYNPKLKVGRKETANVNRMLMKRFYLLEKAKDANIVGILVGTLGVANYINIINRLKKMINLAGKKSYTFVVGKLNVAKLANFMEIDIFVLVACPENSLLDSSEFYKPVITPYEMELACNTNREWSGELITDFRQLLPGRVNKDGIKYVTVSTL